MSAVEVPLSALQPETLTRVIEEFVLREGTDYGPTEFTLEQKVAHVRRQLEQGKAKLLYDERSDSCTIEVA
jgi:uncharacterized protein